MANSFSKEQIVLFDQLVMGFEDQLVLSKLVKVFNTDSTTMERTNNIISRPQPYIAQSFDGIDMTANFVSNTQLSVPATLGYQKSSPWFMTATQLRDAVQEGRIGESAKQKLASEVDIAVRNLMSAQGTLVVKRTAAASGFDDIAQIEAMMNEQGINYDGRKLALSTRDYNGMAANLAGRQTLSGVPLTAYEKARIPQIDMFDAYKLQSATRLLAATATGVTVNGAQYYVPRATSTAVTGEVSNVDNRYMNLPVTVGGSTIKVGDAFTIAGVNAVNHITKEDTGQLKTFRVIAIVTGAGRTGTIQISPPIISATGGTDAEKQYQNVTAEAANGAAITFLNTTTASVNPFWVQDSIELLPGKYVVPTDEGMKVYYATTSQGLGVLITQQGDINTLNSKFRMDIFFGVVNLQPEMTGIILFGQA